MTRFTRSRRKKTLKAVATSLCKRFAINIYYIEINFNIQECYEKLRVINKT